MNSSIFSECAVDVSFAGNEFIPAGNVVLYNIYYIVCNFFIFCIKTCTLYPKYNLAIYWPFL